jgi:hypothetical protein
MGLSITQFSATGIEKCTMKFGCVAGSSIAVEVSMPCRPVEKQTAEKISFTKHAYQAIIK